MSRTIERIYCKDWDDFRRALEIKIYRSGFFVSGEYLYRGQSSVNYRLETSFDRWFQGENARRPGVAE